jgi:hypothetical protein
MDEELKALLTNAKAQGANDIDLGKIIDMYEADASKKKVPASSTLPNQKLASETKTGSSAGKKNSGFPKIDTNGIAPNYEDFKLAVENPVGKEKRLRQKLTNVKVTPENMDAVMAETDALSATIKTNQKANEQAKSQRVKELETSFYDATKNNDDDTEVEQRLQDKINTNGVWNNVKAIAKKSYNKAIGGLASITDETSINDLKVNTDPLAEEKNKVRQEAFKNKQKLTETELDKRAAELFKEKEKENLFIDRANSFLDNMDDKDKNLLKQDRANKSAHLQEDNLKRLKVVSAMRTVAEDKISDYKNIESQLSELKDKNQPFPEELYNKYTLLGSEIKQIGSNLQKSEDYILKNKKDLGTAQQELDLFKREYGDFDNFAGNIAVSTGELATGILGVVNYASSFGSPLDRVRSMQGQEVVSDLTSKLKEVREDLRKPVESVESVEGFVNYASDLVANQIPILVATSTGTAGLGFIGASSAGQKHTLMNDEVRQGKASYSPLQMAVAPLLYGGAEAVGEIATLSILRKGGRVLESIARNEAALISKTAKQKAIEWAKDYGVDMSKEMAGEQFTNFAQNFNDKFILGKKDVNLLDNTGRVFKDTFTLTSILKVAPQTFGVITKPFQSKTDLGILDENSRKIIEFSTQLNTEGLTDVEKTVIQKQIDKITSESSKIVANTIGRIDDIPGELYDEAISLNSKAGEIKSQARIINDGNLSNKEELLKGLSEDYKAIQEKRNGIIKGKTTVVDVLPLKEQEALKKQAMDDLVAELNPDGEKDITITNEQVVTRANEIYNESKSESEKVREIEQISQNPPVVEQTTSDTKAQPAEVAVVPSVSKFEDISWDKDKHYRGVDTADTATGKDVSVKKGSPFSEDAFIMEFGDTKGEDIGEHHEGSSRVDLENSKPEKVYYATDYFADEATSQSELEKMKAKFPEAEFVPIQLYGEENIEGESKQTEDSLIAEQIADATDEDFENIRQHLSDDFDNGNGPMDMAKEYIKAKQDGSNPKLVEAIDKILPINEKTKKPNTAIDEDVRLGVESDLSFGKDGYIQEAADDSASEGAVEVKPKLYKASDNGKSYNVIFEGDRLRITDENGKEPSAPTRRIIEAKYAEDFDFTQGELASYAPVDHIEKHVADNSSNPAEIASTILNFDTANLVENNIGYKESIIADNIGKINEEGYNRNGDRNKVSKNIRRNYFSKDGANLDTLAQEMSEQSGVEITEEDIVDFIDENPNGVKDFFKRISNEKLQPIRDLKTKFTKLTGLPASDKNLIKAVEQQLKKENLEEQYAVIDVMSEAELNELYSQIQQSEKEHYGTAEKNNETNDRSTAGTNEAEYSEGNEEESGVRENGDAESSGEKPTAEFGGIDTKSTPDQILEWLENAEKNLDAFGRENLSVGIPIVVAKTAIQAMKVAVKAGKLASEIIQAGIDAVKQSDWFKNLTQTEQTAIENDFQTNFLNKINAIDPTNERQAENLLNRAASENISEDDAYDEVKSTFDKARTELKNKKLPAEYVRDAYRNFVKRFTDRQYLAKSLLNKSGMKAVQNLIINSHGASGRARIQFEEAYDKIYKSLSTKERARLDEIIQAKRFIAIDNNREARGLEPVSHPNFIDKNKSEKFLSKLEKELGAEKYNDLVQRADAYFDTYKGLLKDMLDNGLISQASFDSMSDVDYQPRVFLQFVTDFNGDLETNKRTNNLDSSGLSSDQIKSMSEGDANSLVLNSEWLLTNSLLSRSKAMAMNNINKRFMTGEFQKAKARFDALNPKNLKGDDVRFYKYFKELSSKVIDNPIVGQTDSSNSKHVFDKTPANFAKAYYYIDGQRHEFFLEKELHESWNDNVEGFLSSDAKEFISYASGAALVKAIATGNNPAFPIVNTPRDFMFTATFSDQYSTIVPKAMIQITKDVIQSIREIRKPQSDVLKKYIEYGGAMDFLSSQGTLKKESLIGQALENTVSANTRDIAKSVFSKVTLHKISQYSEMMFRLGIFQRAIQNQVKELGLNDVSEVADKQQLEDIYNQAVSSARSILDFNQGGSITKDLESVIPYINVAFQGGRVATTALEKDPVGTTSRILQVATMASAIPIGMSLALILAMKSDDDEDKSSYDIYLHALSGVSKYQKMKYMNIVTGKKNEEGEYQIIKIAKAQELSPVMSITDDIYNNFIRKLAGKEKKSAASIAEDALFTFNSNVMPIDVTSPAGLITRTPVVKATLTYATGYDFFREEPLSMDIGKVPKPVEGITMSSTEDFYKKLGENYGLSPIRSKAFVESLITGPSTNPFIGMLYGGADAATSDKDVKKIGTELFNTVYKSTGKRVVGYSSDFNRQLAAKEDLQEKIDKITIEKHQIKAKFNDLAKQFIAKEISKNDLNTELSKLDPADRESMTNKIKDKIKLQDVDGTILDIKYEREAEVKALMIMHYYGDINDGSKDSKEITRQMQRAKGILTPKVFYEYNKLKQELSNKKTPN